MTNSDEIFSHSLAVEDFRGARRRANFERLLSRITGKSTEMLHYSEIRSRLDGIETARNELRSIPIDAIVGSVSRYEDFSRNFLPLRESDRSRWARVKVAVDSMQGVPPIEVYQIGQAYFVKDGHHRVSVARMSGASFIEAYVTPVQSRVELSPDDQPHDILLKAEYADFLRKTHLYGLRPDENLRVTELGMYDELLEHIDVHRYYMGLDQKKPISFEDAVTHWYDTYYSPIARMIIQQNILQDFPGRTETDLYIWVTQHQSTLKEELGWDIDLDRTAKDLTRRFSRSTDTFFKRIGDRVFDLLIPDELEDSTAPGDWRRERLDPHRQDRVFDRILVTVTGTAGGWAATDTAIDVARHEEARLGGLYVSRQGGEKDKAKIVELRKEFQDRCQAAGVSGSLAIAEGNIARLVAERSRYTDLVVLKLSYAPPPGLLQRLRSGLRMIIRRCECPILAVPDTTCCMDRILLSFNNSPRAREALYLTTYLAHRWNAKVTVLTVLEPGEATHSTQQEAREYLESHQIQAHYILQETGNVAKSILAQADARNIDLIVMGSYGARPLIEVLAGANTLDQVLRSTHRSVLICK